MINLLPSEQKQELRREEARKLTLILGIIFLIFLASILLILLSIRINIASELGAQKNLLVLEEGRYNTPDIREFREGMSLLNKNLSEMESFYRQQLSLAEVFEKISETVPPKVYLTHFSWREELSQITLSGRAPLRENLSDLKENLEKEESFTDVYFPPSNWLKSKDIDFYVTFKIGARK